MPFEKKYGDDVVQKIASAYHNGFTFDDIARDMKIHKSTAHRLYRKAMKMGARIDRNLNWDFTTDNLETKT